MLDLEKDILSLNDFQRNTSEFLRRIRQSGEPVVLAIDGEAEVVIQDAGSYQKLIQHVDELETLEGIRGGVADVEAGRVTPLQEFESEFRRKHGLPDRSR